MIIAVLGASGFVGLELVKRLSGSNNRIRVLSRKKTYPVDNVEIFTADLTCKSIDLNDFLDDVDVLYNCSGVINDENLMYDLHVVAIKRVLKLSKGRVKKWVQLGSVGSYGHAIDGRITENSNDNPANLYEETKTISDNMVKSSDIPYVILRPSNIFGVSMSNQSLRDLLNAVRKGLFFFTGKEGSSLVNYIHVEDVVNALVCCGSNEKALGEVFNLSQSTTVEKMIASFLYGMKSNKKILRLPEGVVRAVVGIFGWIPRFPLTSSRVDALTGKCIYDSTKIQKILGFKYSMTLEEGLRSFSKHQ